MSAICVHLVCICYMFVPVHVCALSSRIPQEFSFALSAVQCFVSVHTVFSLLPAEVIIYSYSMQEERCMTLHTGGKAVFRPGSDLWRMSLCKHPPAIQATTHSTCYVRQQGLVHAAKLILVLFMY